MASSRRKVLFVEDEADLRSAYERFFKGQYEMAFAGTGAEALSQFRMFRPDVVVLDLQLPDTDGIDVLRQLRSQRPDVPAVITTAYSSMEPLVAVLGMGHSGYLLKPFDLSELAARIDAAG
jgi:two-component system response regulator (stage 0 sporulation protein F)